MSTTPDSRSDLERLNVVLYHLSEAERALGDVSEHYSPADNLKAVVRGRFHLGESKRQIDDLLTDMQARAKADDAYESGAYQ